MRRKLTIWILTGCLGAAPLAAQPATEVPRADASAQELAGIRTSLDRVATLLETLLRNQQVDLMLKRIELKERRIAPLERRLRNAEEEQANIETEIERFERMLDEQREVFEDEVLAGEDRPDSGTRNMIAEIERVLRDQRARLEIVRSRVFEFEADLDEGRREIEILDDMLADLLE